MNQSAQNPFQSWGLVAAEADTSERSRFIRQTYLHLLGAVLAFIGIEGASVYSRYARRREDVGLATVFGFLGVLCLLVLVTMVPYGVLDRPSSLGSGSPRWPACSPPWWVPGAQR